MEDFAQLKSQRNKLEQELEAERAKAGEELDAHGKLSVECGTHHPVRATYTIIVEERSSLTAEIARLQNELAETANVHSKFERFSPDRQRRLGDSCAQMRSEGR